MIATRSCVGRQWPTARGMWLNTSWLTANPVPSPAAVAATYHFLASPRGESQPTLPLLLLQPPRGTMGSQRLKRGLRMIYANVQKGALCISRLGALAGTIVVRSKYNTIFVYGNLFRRAGGRIKPGVSRFSFGLSQGWITWTQPFAYWCPQEFPRSSTFFFFFFF